MAEASRVSPYSWNSIRRSEGGVTASNTVSMGRDVVNVVDAVE